MKPPLFYRLFNALRRHLEDRHAGEANLVPQLRQLWARPVKPKVYRNLTLVRDARRKVCA
jgi:hypothetical protein